MITTRHMSIEVELIRWLLLVIAALALVLAIATALAAAGPTSEPQLLPLDLRSGARPLLSEFARPFFPEMPPARQLPPAEAAARLWTILEQHHARQGEAALAGWQHVALPEETAHWREIARGSAFLSVGDLERAALHLDAARQLAPDHAVVAYFTGLLRLEQAADAGRLPDRAQSGDLFVAYTPPADRPLYHTLAIRELELAIARAPLVALEEPLLPVYSPFEEAVTVPTASDLLVALGADNFAGKAHHLLFGLRLNRGELAAAEYHLDQSAAAGIAVLYGYRDLAESYLHAEEHASVLRVCTKDLKTNHPWVGQLSDWLSRRGQDAGGATWVW